MQTLQMDEFLRSLKQNIDTPHSLLLGAGASVESGVQSAADCIWEWKKEIFLSQNPGMVGTYDNPKQDNIRRIIQKWIDTQNSYPAENSWEEYSFFVEKAYPIPADRRKYFQHISAGHEPSLGYHLIALLAQKNIRLVRKPYKFMQKVINTLNQRGHQSQIFSPFILCQTRFPNRSNIDTYSNPTK